MLTLALRYYCLSTHPACLGMRLLAPVSALNRIIWDGAQDTLSISAGCSCFVLELVTGSGLMFL